jgi:hypothetical protein
MLTTTKELIDEVKSKNLLNSNLIKYKNQTEYDYIFNVSDLILSHTKINITFDVIAKKEILVPYCNIINVTQGSKRINTSVKRIVNENDTKLNLVNEKIDILLKTILSDLTCVDLEFIMFKIENIGIIKIDNERTINYDKYISILPISSYDPRNIITISAEMKNILNFEFIYNLIEHKNSEFRIPGYYLEQSIVLENTSLYEFNILSDDIRILIPNTSNKYSCEDFKNEILTLPNINFIGAFSRESYTLFDIKLEDPKVYTIISFMHSLSERVKEFTLDNDIYPGSVSLFNSRGKFVNSFVTEYKKRGDKLIINDDETNNIVIMDTDFAENMCTLKINNLSSTNEYITIEERFNIRNIHINTIEYECDSLNYLYGVTPGVTIIECFYKIV